MTICQAPWRGFFVLPARAQAEAAAAGVVGLDGWCRRPRPARRRSGSPGPARTDQLVDRAARVLDQMRQRVAQLADIVRRDAGRHADGDAGGAVGEQVGESAPAAPPARSSRHRRWGGNRPRPRRARPSAPRRPRSGGFRCSAWPRRYRRRYCRNCPARRPAGSARRNPGPDAPSCHRPRRRHEDGICRSRRRPRAHIS